MIALKPKQLGSSLLMLFALGITSSIPHAASKPQLKDLPKLTAGIYIPPPKRKKGEISGDSTIGQERSREGDYSLIAMVPVKTEQLIPVAAKQPTFWFYVPEGCPQSAPDCSLKFELVDYSTSQKLFEQDIDTPQQSGLIGVKVPSTAQSLQVGRNYRWRLRVLDKEGEKTTVVVFGNFEQVTSDATLNKVITSASTAREQYRATGKEGHWFETLSGVLQQYAMNPGDTSTAKDLQSISSSVKVTCNSLKSSQTVTEYFIPLNCIDQVNKQ